MAKEFEADISALEIEKSRLESLLSADERWLTLNTLVSADPEPRSVLENALMSNPYFVARQKIVEAISILRGAGNGPPPVGTRLSIAEKIGTLGTKGGQQTCFAAGVQEMNTPELGAPALQPSQTQAVETELTLLVGIGEVLAQKLAELGYTQCNQVAHWTADDVKRVSGALNLGRRISRENWIEQAALHAARLGPRRSSPEGIPAPATETIEKDVSSAADAAADVESSFFSNFSRPPLFDHRPQRIEPPFVARTLAEDNSSATQSEAQAPAQRPIQSRPPEAPFYQSPANATYPQKSPNKADPLCSDSLGFAFPDSDAAPYRRGSDEAEVVIVGSRPAPTPVAPPSIPPAFSKTPTIGGARSAFSPLRRLMGAAEPHKIDTTPYAEDRGKAEEATVEIVRPKRS
jgi:predicted flap endonuclease-1-like 5' DNA nuclease